jgi:hypothetical protein
MTTGAKGEVMTRQKVFDAIDSERNWQDRKWGAIDKHPHEVGGWLTLIRQHLRDAEAAWSGHPDDREALVEIRKVMALAVACCEQHGVQNRHPHSHPQPENMRSNERLL